MTTVRSLKKTLLGAIALSILTVGCSEAGKSPVTQIVPQELSSSEFSIQGIKAPYRPGPVQVMTIMGPDGNAGLLVMWGHSQQDVDYYVVQAVDANGMVMYTVDAHVSSEQNFAFDANGLVNGVACYRVYAVHNERRSLSSQGCLETL